MEMVTMEVDGSGSMRSEGLTAGKAGSTRGGGRRFRFRPNRRPDERRV